MTKRLKRIVILAAIIVTVVSAALFITLDTIVRNAIVKQSTASLNLPVTLGGAHVSFIGESIGLSRLNISSPSGFSTTTPLLSVGGVHVNLNISHLRATPLMIDRIEMNQPQILIEQSGGKLNTQALSQQPSKTPSDGSQPLQMVIHELIIQQASVTLRPGIPGVNSDIELELPEIVLNDIGTGEGNKNVVAVKDLVTLVLTKIAEKASESEKLPPEVRALLKLNPQQLINEESTKIKGVVEQQTQKNVDKLLKGIAPK